MDEREARIQKRLRRRKRAEIRFRIYGIAALVAAGAFLVFFFADMIYKARTAFKQAEVFTEFSYTEDMADPKKLLAFSRSIERKLRPIVSRGELLEIPQMLSNDRAKIGTTESRWVIASYEVDQYLKGKFNKLKDSDKALVDQLKADGKLTLKFNTGFFTRGHSVFPEIAGIKAATLGTLYVLLITLLCSVPIGVATAIYLEEFAPDNRLTRTIEVNINNLAAVPSILFGLLGLAIVINFFGVPRSSALAGGITLGLMMLPVIIIATRTALRAVPDSIREAAYGIGASPWQVVQHHVLPLAAPGVLTGSIISVARAMGETAPLLLVGLNNGIKDSPQSPLDATTVLPAQIYLWNSEAIRAFQERTAAGILVLLAVLLLLNGFAIWLRNRTERRW
ncbi:MAG: phosphate transport system permease protein [Verrucomicrobiales bacterium]|jgi:phosphate transport system permease protein